MAPDHSSPSCSPSKYPLTHLKCTPSVGFLPFNYRSPSPPKSDILFHSRSTSPWCSSPAATSSPPQMHPSSPKATTLPFLPLVGGLQSVGSPLLPAFILPLPWAMSLPPIRLAIFKLMIGLSVSPSFTPPPVNHRGLSGVENAALGSPDSYAHKNLIDSSQVVGASEGVLASSVSLNEALGIVGSNCCQVEFDSILDNSLFEKLCTSVALAPAISILPSACPQIFSQEKQIQFDALSTTTNHSVSEIDSILIVTGPELSADPLTCPQNSSREEQSHHFAQNASDVVSISVPVSGQSLGPAESSPSVSWSFVVK